MEVIKNITKYAYWRSMVDTCILVKYIISYPTFYFD